MDSGTMWALISMLFGVIVTILVSAYYFKLGTRRRLVPYLHESSSVFGGVDPAIREFLKVSYRGEHVEELTHMQFLIANAGRRAIRDVIQPLALTLPEGVSILDATLLHVSPNGRVLELNHVENRVAFTFDVLNGGEFFVVKLLIRGRPAVPDMKFTIAVDDLPPNLEIERVGSELLQADGKSRFVGAAFVAGCVFLLVGLSVSYVSYLVGANIWQSRGEVLWSLSNVLGGFSVLLSSVVGLLLTLLGIMISLSSFSGGAFPPRRRYVVPEGLLARRLFH